MLTAVGFKEKGKISGLTTWIHQPFLSLRSACGMENFNLNGKSYKQLKTWLEAGAEEVSSNSTAYNSTYHVQEHMIMDLSSFGKIK